MTTRDRELSLKILRAATLCVVALAVCAESLAGGEVPKLEDLGKLLVDRIQNLDGIDVTYTLEDEFLFEVAGVSTGRKKSGTNGRYRTVCLGRKRRFERYLDGNFPSSIIIFDGETTAAVDVKKSQPGRGVTAYLRRGMSHQAAIECQYCSGALCKLLSDELQAKAFAKQEFPWTLLLATDSAKAAAIQLDPQPRKINESSCIAVQFWNRTDSYWLDADRGFALVRRERLELIDGKLDGRRLFDFRSTASDFRQHGEYWIPYRYEREHGAPPHAKERAGEIYYRLKLTVEKFAIGEVTDDDFRIELVEGADVIDADHGHLIVNPSSRLTEIGDLVSEMKSSRRSWWLWFGPVVLAIAVIGVWWWRRRAAVREARVG